MVLTNDVAIFCWTDDVALTNDIVLTDDVMLIDDMERSY